MFHNEGFHRNKVILLFLIGIISTLDGAFNSHPSRIADFGIKSFGFSTFFDRSKQTHRTNVVLNGWLEDTFNSLGLDFALEKLRFKPKFREEEKKNNKARVGTVIRTATKKFDKEASLPSSRLYTTKKEQKAQIFVGPDGVKGDYNHYRSVALSSTPDRAVSILTTDIFRMLRDAGWKVGDGDLGENIYVDGIDYTFFQVGKRFKFKTKGSSEENDGVIVEITERIEPCGNLCKLPYINDESLPPAQRFEQCKKFLLWLDEKEGLRGWYGKIIGDGGVVKLGDEVYATTVGSP